MLTLVRCYGMNPAHRPTRRIRAAHARVFKSQCSAHSFPNHRSASDRDYRLAASGVPALPCPAVLQEQALTRAQEYELIGHPLYVTICCTDLNADRIPMIANQAFNCQHFPKPPFLSRPAQLFATLEVIYYTQAVVGEFIREPHTGWQSSCIDRNCVARRPRSGRRMNDVQVRLWKDLT